VTELNKDSPVIEAKVSDYLAWFRSNGIRGPWSCLKCGTGILKPRYLKQQDGRRYVTLTFCSQECHDAWIAMFRLPGPRWEKYDQNEVLIGYVVPRRGFVSIEEIETAREGDE